MKEIGGVFEAIQDGHDSVDKRTGLQNIGGRVEFGHLSQCIRKGFFHDKGGLTVCLFLLSHITRERLWVRLES